MPLTQHRVVRFPFNHFHISFSLVQYSDPHQMVCSWLVTLSALAVVWCFSRLSACTALLFWFRHLFHLSGSLAPMVLVWLFVCHSLNTVSYAQRADKGGGVVCVCSVQGTGLVVCFVLKNSSTVPTCPTKTTYPVSWWFGSAVSRMLDHYSNQLRPYRYGRPLSLSLSLSFTVSVLSLNALPPGLFCFYNVCAARTRLQYDGCCGSWLEWWWL